MEEPYFIRATLEQIDALLQARYPGCIGTQIERRDATGTLRATLYTFTNATHRLKVRNLFRDGGLAYREEPIA